MRTIDTSAWIEWLISSPTSDKLVGLIPSPSDCIVPTIVQLEVAKWAAREFDLKAARPFLAFAKDCTVVQLDTRIALTAATVWREHGLATDDAIIYATAQAWNVELLTCDAHFKGLPGVIYVAKSMQKKPSK
jgi:predicted nucleic acid-binding protein